MDHKLINREFQTPNGICKFNCLIEMAWIKMNVAADFINAALSNFKWMIVCGQIAEQRVGICSTARTYAMRKTFQFHSTLSAHKFSKHVKIKLFIKIYFCRHGSQFWFILVPHFYAQKRQRTEHAVPINYSGWYFCHYFALALRCASVNRWWRYSILKKT